MQLKAVASATRSGINMTPLIDVVFILLMFFMLASNFEQKHSLQLNTVLSTDSTDIESVKIFTILVADTGQYFLNDKPLEMNELLKQLVLVQRSEVDFVVHLKSHAESSLQQLLDTLDSLTAQGITEISYLPE